MSTKVRMYRGKESFYDGTPYREEFDQDIWYKTDEKTGKPFFFNQVCSRKYHGQHVLYSEGVYTFAEFDLTHPGYTSLWAPSAEYVKLKVGTWKEEFSGPEARTNVLIAAVFNHPATMSFWIPSSSWASPDLSWQKQIKNQVKLASQHGVPVMVHTTDLHQDIMIRPCARDGDACVTISNWEQFQDDTSSLNIRYNADAWAWKPLSEDQTSYVYTWASAFGIHIDARSDAKAWQLAYNQLLWYQYLDVEWDDHYTTCPECHHPVRLDAPTCGFCCLELPAEMTWADYEEYLSIQAWDSDNSFDDYGDESHS